MPEVHVISSQRESLRRGQLERILKYNFNVDPSRLQTAIMRAADGRSIGDALDDDQIIRFFGCERSKIGLSKPLLVVIIAGVRSGKSLLAAVAGITCVFTADLSALKPHLIPKFRIVTPKAENAVETFRHILGAILESPGLQSCLVGEPKWSPHPSLTLRRFDGRLVQISVAAADPKGLSMRSGWMVGFCLDEAALFGEAASGAAVNAEEIIQAAETRVRPGGQGWVVSSPYGPTGLLYALYNKYWGKPGNVLVVRAPTLEMNPDFDAELVERIRLEKPDVAAREYDAEWVDADSAFFEGVLLDKLTREGPVDVPPQAGSRYLAAMDPATRGNAWTLVIARDTRERGDKIAKVEISYACEWVGSRKMPLDPAKVFADMKTKLEPYGIMTVNTDGYASDFIIANAKTADIRLNQHTLQGERQTEVYRSLDVLLRQGRIDLPPVAALTKDLKAVRRRATSGAVRPHLPETSDGRHADFAPSVTLCTALLSGYNFANDLEAAMKVIQDAGGVQDFFEGLV